MTHSDPKFKYQTLIDSFSNCDLKSYSSQEREAFRWVFNPIIHKKNFIPVYLNPDDSRKKDSCIGYALSMYESREKAINRFNQIVGNKPNLVKKLGTHLCKGMLQYSDGKSNDSDATGHFSHFEFEDIDLKTTFIITEELVHD